MVRARVGFAPGFKCSLKGAFTMSFGDFIFRGFMIAACGVLGLMIWYIFAASVPELYGWWPAFGITGAVFGLAVAVSEG